MRRTRERFTPTFSLVSSKTSRGSATTSNCSSQVLHSTPTNSHRSVHCQHSTCMCLSLPPPLLSPRLLCYVRYICCGFTWRQLSPKCWGGLRQISRIDRHANGVTVKGRCHFDLLTYLRCKWEDHNGMLTLTMAFLHHVEISQASVQ